MSEYIKYQKRKRYTLLKENDADDFLAWDIQKKIRSILGSHYMTFMTLKTT